MPSLKVVDRGRHGFFRSDTEEVEEDIFLFIDGIQTANVTFSFIDLGIFGVKCNTDIKIETLVIKNIRLATADDVTILNGKWTVHSDRITLGYRHIVFEHPNRKIFTLFSESLTPTTIFHSSRHRVLFFDENRDEISRLVTSIKDLPFKIACNAKSHDVTVSLNFDFESARASLDSFEFDIPDNIDFVIDDEVKFEFNFLSIRYLFISKISEIDRQYGTLKVTLPEFILTTNGRNYDRWPTNIKCEISNFNAIYMSKIVDLSPTGCTIELPDNCPGFEKNSNLTITVPQIEATFDSEVCSTRNRRRVGVAFRKCIRINLAKLASLSITDPLVPRTKLQYASFLKLYADVGYLSDEDYRNNEVLQSIFAVWEVQDRDLPGSTLGNKCSDEINASLGVLPVSGNSIYAHSLAMTKDLNSISTVSELLSRSFWWAEFLGGLNYYIGAAKNKSKFSTRLLTTFEAQPFLEDISFDALKISLGKYSQSDMNYPKYNLEQVDFESCDPKKRSKLFLSLSKNTEYFKEIHEIKLYRVDSENRTLGYLIHHIASFGHTAANIFNTVIFSSNVSGSDIVVSSLISTSLQLCPKPDSLEILLSEVPTFEVADGSAILKHWYVIEKNDFAAVLPSVSKVLFSVLRKYGDEAVEHLKKAII